MARIYTNTSVVGAGLNGLYEGLKDAEDQKFRNAEQTMKAEQFAAERYLKARRNKAGGYGGLDIDEEKIDRDTPIAEAKYPEYFSKTTQEASPEVFSNETDFRARAMQDLAPQAPPVQTPTPAPAPQPIQPLLKSKESIRQESDMAMAKGDQEVKAKIAEGNKPVSLGKEQYTGTEAGVDKFEQPVNTNVSFDEGMTYAAPKEEVKERFRPSNIAMTNIMAGLGNKEANSDPQIPMTSLPPEVKKIMGIAPEFQGSLRSSIVKELIQAGSKKAALGSTKDISPAVLPFADKARSGMPLGEVIKDAMDAKGSVLNDAEVKLITGQSNQNSSDKRFGLQQEKAETEKNKLSPKNEDRVQAIDALKYRLNEINDMVTSGRVKPRLALDIARRFGVVGGAPSEVANAAMEAAGEQPLSPDELQFLKLTSQVGIQDLVKAAGTTFTERFGNLIFSLGADIADGERFNQNMKNITGGLDFERQNVIGTSQANKSGKIQTTKSPVSRAEPKANGLNPTQFRIEMQNATSALKAAKDEKAKAKIKSMFKQRTGIDY